MVKLETREDFQEHLRKIKEEPGYKEEFKKHQEQQNVKYWMELKAFKDEDDVPPLPHMNEFFTNRLIELGAIPKNKLEDGIWYYGNYRNTALGKWNHTTQKFDHYRWKFGWQTDDCNHFEDDNGYALFVPLRKANEEELEHIEKIGTEYHGEKL